MSEWPLSPALRQRQHQLEARRLEQQAIKAQREEAKAEALSKIPFSPSAFIRNGAKESSAPTSSTPGTLNTSHVTGTTGSGTPRTTYSIRYEMGFSNLDKDRSTIENSNGSVQKLIATRNHMLQHSSVAKAARTETMPAMSPSSQITHGGHNTLGSPARRGGGANLAADMSRAETSFGHRDPNASAASMMSGASQVSARSPARSFQRIQNRAQSAGASVSAASKHNAFASTLQADKHKHNNVSTRGWNNHININIPNPKKPATSAKINQTNKKVHEQLEDHLNDLIGLKYRCEQAMDAMAKQYSVLVNDAQEAEQVIQSLSDRYHQHDKLLEQWNRLPALATHSPTMQHESQRMAEVAAQDPHRGAFKDGMWTLNPLHNVGSPGESATRKGTSSRLNQAEAGASYAAASRGATRGGQLLLADGRGEYVPRTGSSVVSTDRRPDTAAFVGLNNAEKALHYGPVILKEIAFLRTRIDRCRQLLADTASSSDKLQHLSMLIDVATNVDLVCLGRLDTDATNVVVPASPAFPTLTLSDFDEAENEAASLTAYCCRAASELRKSVQSAVAGHSQCFEALIAAMRLGVKCAEAKRAESQRQIDEIDRDTIQRVQRHLDECLQEEARCAEQLTAAQKIITVRTAALSNNVFGDRGGPLNDPVIAASKTEVIQLERRRGEIDAKKERLLLEYDSLQRERERLEEIVASAAVSQQLIDEIRRHH